jgi:O-acetyl-ADP-ribose deacetylase (regulator of RNase III)
MIKISPESVFNVDAKTLVNTVNCVGVMGAGLALEFRLRYSQLFHEYEFDIKQKKVQLGKVNYYQMKDIKIVNFPTKFDFKYPSKLEWISTGLDHFIQTYASQNITKIAFPKLGSSNGGLEWKLVKELMVSKLAKLPIEIIICEDSNPANGLELTMINALKKMDLNQLDLRQDKYRVLELKLNRAKRFFEIMGEGLGIDSYEKIYSFIYSKVSQGDVWFKNAYNEEVRTNVRDYFYSLNWKNSIRLNENQVRKAIEYINFSKNNGFSFYDFITLKALNKISKFCLSNFNHVSLF